MSVLLCYFSLSPQDSKTGHFSLTLKASKVLEGKGERGGGLMWTSKSLAPGLKVKGTVVSVTSFGVFIEINDSKVGGFLFVVWPFIIGFLIRFNDSKVPWWVFLVCGVFLFFQEKEGVGLLMSV